MDSEGKKRVFAREMFNDLWEGGANRIFKENREGDTVEGRVGLGAGKVAD